MITKPEKWLIVVLVILVQLLSGCAASPLRNPVPAKLDKATQPPGITEARFWGDEIPPHIERRMHTMSKEEVRSGYPALFGQPHNYLAISGGGSNGAFGAGLLTGWTETGNRPSFQMVTGISTGALIAPWAFLGSDYDHVLKEVYTTISTSDILDWRAWFALLYSNAAADSTPLLNTIQRYVDDEVILAIAAEHRTGRRLFIGTTDLDQMRSRIWDIGAIAASGTPDSTELIQKIMLASASIPGAFPPVRIEVMAEGQVFDELHVDGGTTSQVFVYPAAMNWRKLLTFLEVPGPANIYVIRNSKLKPDWQEVEPKLFPITGRSISSLIRTQGIGDLYLIYLLTLRDGGRYRLATIPNDFEEQSTEPFDTTYMNKLFSRGYQMARRGYPWHETPPGWEHVTEVKN